MSFLERYKMRIDNFFERFCDINKNAAEPLCYKINFFRLFYFFKSRAQIATEFSKETG